jgi:hypothetical protein
MQIPAFSAFQNAYNRFHDWPLSLALHTLVPQTFAGDSQRGAA